MRNPFRYRGRPIRRKPQRRRHFLENLERRFLLASNWTNQFNARDVNSDGEVTPSDVLVGINQLNSRTLIDATGQLPDRAQFPTSPLYDVDGDGRLAPLEILIVINALNQGFVQPTIDVFLSNDTSLTGTNDDRVTSDPTVAGQLGGAVAQVARVRAQVDQGVTTDLTLVDDGFTFDPSFADDGSEDGSHVVRVTVFDQSVIIAAQELSFTYDSQPPSPPTFDLATGSDTGTIGDQVTQDELVSLSGQAEPDARLDEPDLGVSTMATGSGAFQVNGLPLTLGENTLTLRASDRAGNSVITTQTITRSPADGAIVLNEGTDLLNVDSVLVDLGLQDGSRTLSFDVEADFDATDQTAISEDRLLVYLVDPSDPTRTLLDRGETGTALFSLAGDRAEFPPGLVRFDGSSVRIDVSSLPDLTQGRLLFQLLNTDGDTGSQIAITNVESTLDPEGVANPELLLSSDLADVDDALDLSSLTMATGIDVHLTNVRVASSTGRYTAELHLANEGQAQGRRVVVTIPALPDGVTLLSPSGIDADGDPYLNLTPTIDTGGLRPGATSRPVLLEIDNPSLAQFSLNAEVLVGAPNSAPVIEQLDPITTMPGDVVEVPLSVTDADGDQIAFSVEAAEGLPTSTLRADGTLTLAPRPDELGTYVITVIADDGALQNSAELEVNVVADPVTTTRLSGIIQNTDEQPLANIPIELGTFQTTTDSLGRFTLDFGTSVPSMNDALFVRGEAFAGPESYPFIAEKLHLLLNQVFDGVNNVVARPIYLPALNTADAVTIDPAVDTTVSVPLAPGEADAAVFVAANSLHDQDGNPFAGDLSITEVPAELTPAALPIGFIPDSVVTIQPGEMVFTQPAPLTLPNRSGLPAGFELDLWSINPVTGTFDVVGKGRVSADGTVIDTIDGGIRNSSWHLFVLSELNITVSTSSLNLDDGCEPCEKFFPGTSSVKAHSGEVVESHRLPTYESLGETRGVQLVYSSLRADPRPIVHGAYNLNLTFAAPFSGAVDVRGISSLDISGNNLNVQGEDHFWRSGPDSNRREIAILADLSTQPSGLYDYTLNTGIQFASGSFGNLSRRLPPTGVRSQTSGQLIHVNSSASVFGSGWELAGLQYLVENVDGSVLLVDGNGAEILFELAADGASYESPPGHFSTLERAGDGTFSHTTIHQTVSTFDGQNRLAKVADRNGNETTYEYSDGQLVSMTDPVGLVTTFHYTAGKVSSITDPVNRTTLFEYDSDGNLIRVTDPDGTSRNWEYDDRHHIVAEVDKRGFREEMQYDFAGRAQQATRKDGSVLHYRPVQVQGLFPPVLTTDFETAPPSSAGADLISTFVDGNGNVVEVELNHVGQSLGSQDGVGSQGTTRYNDDLLPVAVTDARGFESQFTYDANGNLASVLDSISSGGFGGISYPSPSQSLDGVFGRLFNDDINGDGIQDFINGGIVYLGDGVGGLQTPIVLEYSEGDPVEFRVADMNGDGLKDIIGSPLLESSEIFPGLLLWLAKQDGTFESGEAFSTQVLPGDLGDDDARDPVLQPGLAVVDFNDDGLPDVVLTQPTDETGQPNSSLVLMPNVGGGVLGNPTLLTDFNLPANVWSVETADLNKDGNPDLVLTNTTPVEEDGRINDHFISVKLGDGAGGFGAASNYDLGVNFGAEAPLSVQDEVLLLKDFNLDGELDVVVASAHLGFVSVMLGDGLGGFTSPNVIAQEFVAIGSQAAWTAIASDDFNGDNVPDIAVTRFDGKEIAVMLGNGDGTFTARTDYKYDTASFFSDSFEDSREGLYAIDFDNDDILDLVTAGHSDDLAYLKGVGDGTFVSWRQIDTSSLSASAPKQIETIDLDQDGLLDTVTRTHRTGVEVRFGLDDGEFTDAVVLESGTPAETTRQLAFLDANGDGFQDIAYGVAAFSTQTLRLHIYNQDRTFSAPTTLDFGVERGGGLASGDFNKDGNDDLVVTDRSSNSSDPGEIKIALGDGTGAFTFSSITLSEQPEEVVVADVNNDGNRDLIVSRSSPRGAVVLLGDGSGGFSEDSTVAAGSIDRLQVADFNADGFADLAFVVYNNAKRVAEVKYVLNDGAGQFGTVQNAGIAAPAAPATLRPFLSLDDLNGDGLPDVVLASRFHFYVAMNNQGSGFGSVQSYRGGGFAPSLVDVDGDGAIDIVGARANLVDSGMVFHNENAITIYYGRQEADSSPRSFTYDPVFNQLASITDELGRQTFFEIDPVNGNTRSVTQVIGLPDATSEEVDDLVTRYTYLGNGLVDTITDPLGRITEFEYDSLGRNTQITLAAGTADEGIVAFIYDAAGNVIQVIDPNLNQSTFTYDALNRQLTATDALSASSRFTYDAGGNLTESLDRAGSQTTYQYDAISRPISVTDDQSNVTQYEYDQYSNPLRIIDPLGQQSRYRYDARNRTTSLVDPDGGVTRSFYDADNNLNRLIDPVGNLTQFTYDARNRLTSEIDPLGARMSYDYDTVNNLVRTVDRNGRETEFTYDDVDRLSKETWLNTDESVSNTIDYSYDKASNLLSVVDDFSALAWTYDARNRALTESNAGTPNTPGVQLDYTYDPAGNVLSVTDTINGTAGAVSSYLYDALNRMEQISQTANGGLSVADKRVDIQYNAIGQFDAITRYSDLLGTELVVSTEYQYDSLNRLERLAHNNSTGTAAFYDYHYDSDDRITQITDIDGVTNYTYDDRDQLTGAEHQDASNPDEKYTYDANGNRIDSHLHSSGYVTGSANRLISDGLFDYQYDAEGNRIRQTAVATGDYREFGYDHRNRVVSVVDYSSADAEQQRVEFGYDAIGRRITKSVDGVTTHFVYDGSDVLLDFEDTDGPGGNAPALTKRYLHGPFIDQVLAQESGDGSVSWLLTDHLGTTRDIVDTTGQVLNHLVYESFGNLIRESNASISTRYQFTGRESDREIDLLYYRTRFYDSAAGVFLSEDRLRFVDGPNLTRYVLNDPLRLVDPFGQEGQSGGPAPSPPVDTPPGGSCPIGSILDDDEGTEAPIDLASDILQQIPDTLEKFADPPKGAKRYGMGGKGYGGGAGGAAPGAGVSGDAGGIGGEGGNAGSPAPSGIHPDSDLNFRSPGSDGPKYGPGGGKGYGPAGQALRDITNGLGNNMIQGDAASAILRQ